MSNFIMFISSLQECVGQPDPRNYLQSRANWQQFQRQIHRQIWLQLTQFCVKFSAPNDPRGQRFVHVKYEVQRAVAAILQSAENFKNRLLLDGRGRRRDRQSEISIAGRHSLQLTSLQSAPFAEGRAPDHFQLSDARHPFRQFGFRLQTVQVLAAGLGRQIRQRRKGRLGVAVFAGGGLDRIQFDGGI